MSRLTNARDELERYEQTKPADYQSKYQGQINDVMSKLNDLGEYDYDPAADTAYQQYKSQYTRSAKLANQNAQANAAAQTGGYSSSYGTQAGQNAYTTTMNNLDNVLNSLQDQSRSEYTAKRTGLWQYLKDHVSTGVYRAVRYNLGGLTDLKFPGGDKLTLGVYRQRRKIFKFN